MHLKSILSAILCCVIFSTVNAQKYTQKQAAEVTKEWNSQQFSSSKTLDENINDVSDFSFLNKILDEKLKSELNGKEMVTIFAPVDAGFMKLSEASRDSLVARGNDWLKFYVVSGRVDSNTLEKEMARKNGTVYLATLSGERLGVRKENDQLILFDASNNKAVITASDFYHKNGYFHIVDGLVFPSEEQ